ncbi:hypothetical protein AVEN_60511-1 [Araneus ventricosus]|uniref:DNA helicase Pif1-like 2B domain-containing protein n=1 Tax=Araneus ventricosus TaxID=182803 RepID=A0A4Y2G8T6_ARAVE|nr:hypothetical protein AVEN_60511-1 [Araneus ventricosus]
MSFLQTTVQSYPVEFFNSLELSGVLSDKLRLKVGVPVLLIRNLDVPRLLNGTRLQITYLGQNVVPAPIMTGIARGESFLIPRIPIIPKDLPSQFKRLTNTYVVTDVLFHNVTGCIGHSGAATSTTILSFPGPSKPVADEQMEEVGAVLENDSSTTTLLLSIYPKQLHLKIF